MTKKLSALELTIMERRFRKSEQDSAIRNYRRKKGESAVSQGSRWAQKMVAEVRAGEAAAAANRASAASAETFQKTDSAPKPHVVIKVPFDDPAIPFKHTSIVLEVGATIGNKVALNHRDETMVAAGLPSLLISISKLGTEIFRVYPDYQSAKAAADKDNEALDNYIKSAAKAAA